MVPTPHPSRVIPHRLLSTRELINRRHPILATLPQPAPIRIFLYSFPLETGPCCNLHISTSPYHTSSLGGVRVGIQRYRAGQIPISELGDGASDVDAVAPFGADFDGEGEGDCFGVFAGRRGVAYRDGEGCGGFAFPRSVDLVGVHVGVDGAVVGEVGSGVGDVVGVCSGDCLG